MPRNELHAPPLDYARQVSERQCRLCTSVPKTERAPHAGVHIELKARFPRAVAALLRCYGMRSVLPSFTVDVCSRPLMR